MLLSGRGRVMRHVGWMLVGIFIVLLSAIYIDLPNTHDFFGRPVAINKGIDLAGGVRVLECAKGNPSSSDMSTARDVIASRVSGGFGVSEPQVNLVNGNCISVEVPGLDSAKQEQIQQIIGQTGYLALTDSGTTPLNNGVKVKLVCSGGAAAHCPPGSKPGSTNATANPPVLNVIAPGYYVSRGSAQVGFDGTTGQPQVTYTLNGSGSDNWCN